ncbi:30S ribosome-binding factor RbfA [Aliikangiella coralliicola]|uniref:Ribosome-binding factor A n=1 Tax=Aliikangiella coralliicola TaxID=2592383 RepID=A0A545UEB7_9GAMM|nr:30S ribosome-binding factor RbfA [Aliikangiella coralliicola]TQV87819.1 30S ribosome-binding factor RbfA [Aliikangiella coralliicola]
MAREFNRTDRVSEQLQRELAQIIQMEIKDPRVGMVTVSAVEVSRDLCYSTVFVTFLGIDEDKKSIKVALDVLNNAAGFIRGLIGKRMKLRVVPQIKFEFDKSIARGSELSALIKKARDKDSDADAAEGESE